MNNLNLVVGDVVKLISGSYPMTIEKIEIKDGRILAHCVLIDQLNNVTRNQFYAETLFKLSS